MEENVYVCTWSRSAEGYVLRLRFDRRIQASGPTYAQAEARLLEAIRNAGGAMCAVLEFNPPLPKSALEARYAEPELYLICGDERFETGAPRWRYSETAAELDGRLRWSDEFYNAPLCRKCKSTFGRRTNKPITLTYAPRFDGAFGSVASDGGPTHQLLSEEFLTLLTEQEARCLELLEVVKKGRRKFYELVGPEGPSLVGVSALKHSGWRCTHCGHKEWGYWLDEMAMHEFVARRDLSSMARGVFTVGSAPEIMLAATAERWQQLVGRKGTRGFTSTLVGIAPDQELVRCPELPPLGQ